MLAWVRWEGGDVRTCSFASLTAVCKMADLGCAITAGIARLDRILPARLSYELARRATLMRSIGAQARDGDLG